MKGKAKIDFEQWYKQKYFLSVEGNCDSCGCGIGLPFEYDRLPETMQQGVLREFFESKGIIICLYRARSESDYACLVYDINSDWSAFIKAPDYSTAFTHAIDKACEIYGGEG